MAKFDLLKCKYLGCGRNRIVYLLPSGKNVIKIPLSEAGENNNYDEAFRYSKRIERKSIPLARCRMVKDTPYLIMEYVIDPFAIQHRRKYTLCNMPTWVEFVDCRQVGYTRQNKLVAYDYA